MLFRHATEIWREYPELVPGVVHVTGVDATADVAGQVAEWTGRAAERLDGRGESELAEIQAWRRAFGRMGLKPTKYRCAAESLLRRYRREGALPSIHPLVDLGNAVSLAYAVPVAVLDLAGVAGDLTVRPADGDEDYRTLAGEPEHPEPGEIIFADGKRRAHSRRWTNRQSAHSTVGPATSEVLIVAEALHGTAVPDVTDLVATLVTELRAAWDVSPRSAVLTRTHPTFTT